MNLLRACTPAFLHPSWERLSTSPVGRRLVKGAFWSLVGAVLSRGLGLVSSILVARMLGKDGFGELAIIQSTVGMFGAVAFVGLGVTATKYVACYRESNPERAGRVITLSATVSWVTGILAGLAVFAGADWLAERTLAAPQLAVGLRIGALLATFGAVNGAQQGALAGFEAYRRMAYINLATGLASFLLLPSGCWLFGLTGVVAGSVLVAGLGCALNHWGLAQEASRWHVPLWSASWKCELPLLWQFTLPTALASLLVAPTLWFCQTMLVRQAFGYQNMAEYAVGNQWRILVVSLPSMLFAAYLPITSSVAGRGGIAARHRLLWRASGLSAGATSFAAMVVLATSPWILAAYGSGFAAARMVLTLLLVTAVLESVIQITMNTLLASGWPWIRLALNGIWSVVQVAGAVLLVPIYGAMGLALSVCLAQCLNSVLQFILARISISKDYQLESSTQQTGVS